MTADGACTLDNLTITDSGLLTGRVSAPLDADSQRLDIFLNGRLLDTIQAAMPLGLSEDPVQHWLGFDYSLRHHQIGPPARLQVCLPGGEAIGKLDVTRRAPRIFDAPDTLRSWLFHNRFLPAQDCDGCQPIFTQWAAEARAGIKDLPAEGPKISVVMPVFQPDALLFRAIDSVRAQTWSNWELVIIDDGSVNFPSLGPILDDTRIRLFRVPVNIGQSRVRNLALSMSSGEAVAFLDSDCWWHPDFLEVMIHALSGNKDIEAAYCGQVIFDKDNRCLGIRSGDFHPSLIDNENYIDINCLMVKRDALTSVGQFSETLGALEDWDLIRRLNLKTRPHWVKANLSNYITQRPNSVSQSILPRIHWPEIIAKFKGTVFTTEIHDTAYDFDLGLAQKKSATGVSIVIPSYNIPDVLDLCIERLVDSLDCTQNEIIICDNGSGAQTQDCLAALLEKYPYIILEKSNLNNGFTWAANKGIEIANPNNDIVLLNNDAIVTYGWLEALQAPLKTRAEAGIVVPRQILPPGTHTIGHHAPAANLHIETDVNLSSHHGNVILSDAALPDGCLSLRFAPFFCAYITRDLIRDIGPLSQESGRHYHSDSDYCARARKAGYDIIYTPDSRVYHLLQRSTKDLSRRFQGNFGELFA